MNRHILLILVVSLFIIFKETKCDFEYEDHDEPPKNSNSSQPVTDSNETSSGDDTACVICSKCPGNQVLLRGKCRTIKSKFLFSLKF